MEERVLLGLRGPLIDGAAQILETNLSALFGEAKLEGRAIAVKLLPPGGVRDLASYNDQILILSGSENDDTGGASIYIWDGTSAAANKLCDIPDPPKGSDDKPEALLVLDKTDKGLHILVLSDGVKDGNPREFLLQPN